VGHFKLAFTAFDPVSYLSIGQDTQVLNGENVDPVDVAGRARIFGVAVSEGKTEHVGVDSPHNENALFRVQLPEDMTKCPLDLDQLADNLHFRSVDR
jgi:hypothetical protein